MKGRYRGNGISGIKEQAAKRWTAIALCLGLMLSLAGNAASVAFAAEDDAIILGGEEYDPSAPAGDMPEQEDPAGDLTEEETPTDEAPSPEPLAEPNGIEPRAVFPKYLNQWSFIGRNGEKMGNETSAVVTDPSQSMDDLVEHLKATVLPEKIRGWVSQSDTNGVFWRVGFAFDADQSEDKYEMTKDGPSYIGSSAYQWGRVNANWELVTAPDEPEDGAELIFRASPNSAVEGGNSYVIYVNSNEPSDYAAGNKDTATNPDILTFKVTMTVIDLDDHIVRAADPQNVKVNLFDYWVDDGGESPTAPNGDILNKSDTHTGDGRTTPGANDGDWNRGINEGHLLLFGDGLVHAGLWNKGAGESCDYGKAYAGMEGIVKNILPESGYPEINTENAAKQMTGVTDTNDPAYRDHTKIRDWQLTGDHTDSGFNSADIQNLSNTVIGTWGGDIEKDTESLDYLFSPEDGDNKKSYENVTGLFQLDNDGYYYYDMRENFAELSQDGNSFILYDAPATIRTDAAQSVGNFLPFNKGAEVFTGIEDGELTSSVLCHHNAMNHHLGMTVDVDFRQPVNGLIGTGVNAKPMTFEFSGDDDVWVYIDDVLVLDLGGIHSEIYGTIDYETGKVCIGRAFSSHGIPENPEDPANLVTETTLKRLFEDAGVEIKDSDWKGDTFASNTTHTLRMFYLERGNYDSSIALRFNLQPLLYQHIAKVDQNGSPLPGVEFELYPARSGRTGEIECLYTDDSSVNEDGVFYVTPDLSGGPLVTLATDDEGYAVFHTPEGGYFNFADLGDRYYVLREVKAPEGYRAQPIDIALHYDSENSMLTVANRWTMGAYACSVSNITGPQQLYYAADMAANGQLESGGEQVPSEDVKEGLVVAVPLLKQRATGSWMALYGSNLRGFGSVEAGGDIADWRGFILEAALKQAGDEGYAGWHLDWDAGNTRLYGRLTDLPGLASRYLLNDPEKGDMQMVYGVIPPEALEAMGIGGEEASQRYEALRRYVQENGVEAAIAAVKGVGDGNAFRLISTDRFNRNFRSLIYIPNERRELRVLKIDQDGRPLKGARFGLFENAECRGRPASSGVTDGEGMLVFSPIGDSDKEGQAGMAWANSTNTRYYLKETEAPSGHKINGTVIPVVVGIYGVYADAGEAGDGVTVVADVGRLTQTMRQYAMGNDVDVTLQDITAVMQVQPSGSFELDGWEDAKLGENSNAPRSMNLHFERNNFVDYGLHDQDGGKNYAPFFVTDTGFVRTRVRQNYDALTGKQYDAVAPNANKDDLGAADLTNLFSLLNMVVVTDRLDTEAETGRLTVSKELTGEGLTGSDLTKLFSFTVELTDSEGTPLDGEYDYYFYGTDKAGKVSNGETLLLHHNEALTILGLPKGTRFTVTEKGETGWYVLPRTAAYSGEITADRDFNAAFVNSKEAFPEIKTGDLKIEKKVTGSAGDKAKRFDFSVALTGEGSFVHDGVTYNLPCTLTFALAHGESVTLKDLPVGTEYMITEGGNEGYEVTKTGDGGVIAEGLTSEAEFVNHKDGGNNSSSGDDDDSEGDNKPAKPDDKGKPVDPKPVDPNPPVNPDNPVTDRPDGSDSPDTFDGSGDIGNSGEPNGSELPKTGVDWLTPCLLAAAGAALVLMGLASERKERHKS